MEFLKVLNQGWVGAIIGTIGLVIAFFIYRASRVSSQLVHQDRALRLVGRKEQALPSEVKILFKNKEVERLTKTRIILWNSGKATINGSDIVSSDPLRLEVSKDSEVLSVHISKEARKSNRFTVNINPDSPNEVICSFDYLDPHDGVVIELLHTGERRYPEILGTIRGMPKGIIDFGLIPPSRKIRGFQFKLPFKVKYVFIGFLLYSIFATVYGFFRLQYPVSSIGEGTILSTSAHWLFIGFFLLLIILCSYALWLLKRRFPKSLATDDYEG